MNSFISADAKIFAQNLVSHNTSLLLVILSNPSNDKTSLINHTRENQIKTTLSQLSRVPVDVACDYIFTSRDINIKKFSVSDVLVSDHKALILDFTFQ